MSLEQVSSQTTVCKTLLNYPSYHILKGVISVPVMEGNQNTVTGNCGGCCRTIQ